MELYIGFAGILVMTLLIAIGVPIAIALSSVAIIGLLILMGPSVTIAHLSMLPFREMSSYVLASAPLFILMGDFISHSDFGRDLFDSVKKWVGSVKGGLAMSTVIGGTILGASCGSILAATAVLGRVALPEMERQGYSQELSSGSISAAGTIAGVIPPSMMLILYGLLTHQSIGALFIAGIMPGVMSAVIYCIGIYVMTSSKTFSGRIRMVAPPAEKYPMKEKIASTAQILPFVLLIILVIGGIYGKLFTPTEAGAAGAFGALMLVVLYRRFTLRIFKDSLISSASTSSYIFIMVVAALLFGRFITHSGIPSAIAGWVVSLPFPPTMILVGILICFFIFGMFIEPLGLLFIIVPIIYPVVQILGYNPIWFGILVMKAVEIGCVTPPLGVNCYVMKGVAKQVPMSKIFYGSAFFVILDIIALAFLIAFPQITLYLVQFFY